jgi:hypothetical protein
VTAQAVAYDSWMQDLFLEHPGALNQSLARFVFPGSHDAGTYRLSQTPACEGCAGSDLFTDLVRDCQGELSDLLEGVCVTLSSTIVAIGQAWGRAQHRSVGQQLSDGARVFDLRFFRATTEEGLESGRFYIHHSLTGPDSDEIFDDIEAFVEADAHQFEIVILKFQSMREGDGAMSDESLAVFFDDLRSRIGHRMAPKQDPACADDPTCRATARFGHATTLRDFLEQGSRVIVTCDCVNAPDIWDSLNGVSPYDVDQIYPHGDVGYPVPDDPDHPWTTDLDAWQLINALAATRDSHPQDEMFNLGVQIGLDEDGTAIIRSAVCPLLDPGNASGYCDAREDDWDEFRSLFDMAAYTNRMILPALVKLPRDRVNLVTGDHYDRNFTEEVVKLNWGATQVELLIREVEALEDFDNPGNEADFYPVFRYPDVGPTAWGVHAIISDENPGDDHIFPNWYGWKAYPNTQGIADPVFSIRDNDDNADDFATIDGVKTESGVRLSILGCVKNSTACVRDGHPDSGARTIEGTDGKEARVKYDVNQCVWSWVPIAGLNVDSESLCEKTKPQLRIWNGRVVEGNSGRTAVTFVVTLSAPSLGPVTVTYTADPHGDQGETAGVGDIVKVDRGQVVIPAGETRAFLSIEVNGDLDVEGDEAFFVRVTSSEADVVDDTATGTIVNDDIIRLRILPPEPRPEGNPGDSNQLEFRIGSRWSTSRSKTRRPKVWITLAAPSATPAVSSSCLAS